MTRKPRNIALVLSGGGVRGLAHIGVLKVLRQKGIPVSMYIGTSIGALIASLGAAGVDPAEMERIALSLRRSDLFDLNVLGLLFGKGRMRTLYKGNKFHLFLEKILPVHRFQDLPVPLYVTSVDLNSGAYIVWGTPGMTDVSIPDAVYASCALPGIFRPQQIDKYYYVDGSVAENLPIRIARYHDADLILAVYLGAADESKPRQVQEEGIFSIVSRALMIQERMILERELEMNPTTPLVLVKPRVSVHGTLDFTDKIALIAEGERAAKEALDHHPLLEFVRGSA